MLNWLFVLCKLIVNKTVFQAENVSKKKVKKKGILFDCYSRLVVG